VVAATEVTVTVAVAEAEAPVNVTDDVVAAQVGRFAAPLGDLVRAQLSVTVPE
jgi:hypothetical protein